MTDREPTNADLRDEVYKLADACVHEALSDEDYRRLEELLSRDETARLYYVDYLHDAYQLHRMAALASADDECAEVGTFAEGPFSEIYFNAAPLAPAHEPGGGWQAVISYCSQVGPLSYMAAAVITCALLLVGWACKISHHRHFDVAAGPTYESPLNDRRELVFVGRISGMKDCRWSNPDTGTYLGASAPQGREYALASGLIEITYKSGARVILEGPCTYKVESSACGFLERGKLTANIRTQSSKLKAQTSEHSPLSILHPTLFAVRTPTAIVADLGTEFGVEVDANGETTSHVFQGSVQVQILPSPASGRGDGGEGGKILRKDESIRVSRVRAGTRHESAAESVRFTRPANPPKFVRRIEQPPKSIDLLDIVAGGNGMKGSKYIALVQTMPVGYWRFDEQPAGTQSTGAPGSLIDSTGNGHDGRTFGSPLPYYSSDVKGYPRSAIALTRKSDDNDAGEDCIVIPHHPDFNLRMADGVDYLIEADIKLSGFDYAGNHTPTIFSKGVGWNSYAFRVNTAGKLSLYIQGAADGTPSADICGNTAVNDGAWHHVAVLIDSNETDALSSATFYVDGKPDGAVVLRKNDGSAWTNENIDAASNADHGDEVLIGDYGDVSRETYYRKNYSQFVGSIGAVKFSLVPETATLPPDGGGPAGWDRLIGDDVFPDAGAATFGSVLLRAADDPQLDRTIISKLLAAPADREEKSPPAQPGLLFVRPNSNITVDLRALRKLYRGSRPISFKAVVGAAGGEADFRVLVDGQPKFIRTKLRTEDGPVEVNVELGPDDRLLRLVADGGNGGSAGWIVLGNPSLDITEIESEN